MPWLVLLLNLANLFGNYWAEAKASSRNGLRQMYENGEISSDAMAYMEAIWGLSDEDWKKLEEEYSNGNISKEDFEALQEIRDIPEEWVTEDNLNKGLNIGMRNGAWEGIQWGLSSYLNNWSSGISKLKTIFTRVGTDVTFAGFDTAYKAWVDSDVTGGSFEESWDELGGWTSTGIKVGIAFLASVANEIGTYYKDASNVEGSKGNEEPTIEEPKGGKEPTIEEPTIEEPKYVFEFDDSVPAGYKDFVENITSSFSMSESLGKELESILDADGYVIGIHCSGIADPDSILEKGLWLTGDSSSGVAPIVGEPDLTKNIIFMTKSQYADTDFVNFCKGIESASGYKNDLNTGNAIIVKIPKEDFDNIGKITYYDGTNDVLKPEYILGYVTVHTDSTGHTDFTSITYNNSYSISANVLEIAEVIGGNLSSTGNVAGRYKMSVDKTNAFVTKMEKQGYSPNAIVSELLDIAQTGHLQFQRDITDYSFAYLHACGFSPINAADIINTINTYKIYKRGMYEACSSENISYNVINQFNDANQVYDLNSVIDMVGSLPKNLKDSINEVNLYDCYNPADYHWDAKYSKPLYGYFVSAASGGAGKINLWAGSLWQSKGTISHEAGHCFWGSLSQRMKNEFMKACKADYKKTGKANITEYGKNSIGEEFAESVAAYVDYIQGNNEVRYSGDSSITNFPNRLAWLEKYIGW